MLILLIISDTEGLVGLDERLNLYGAIFFIVLAVVIGVIVWGIKQLFVARPQVTCRCAGCGYNLFANESGICPECGKPAPGGGGNAVCDWPEMTDEPPAET